MTHFVESPGSSPLSGRYPLTPSSPFPSIQSSSSTHGQKNLENFHPQYRHYPNTVPLAIPSESLSFTPPTFDAAHAPHHTTPVTLKPNKKGNKKHSMNCDSCENDGVSTSDSKRKSGNKKDKEKKAETASPVPSSVPSSSADSFLTIESTSDSTFDFSILRKRVESFPKVVSDPSSMLVATPFDSPGYETDVSKKSKKKKKNGGHDKDVKKARSLFFRLGSKSSKGDLGRESPKSVSMQMKSPPLPSAERFVTSLNKDTGAPMIALGSDSNQPSVEPLSSPGSGLGIDLRLGLSAEMFSAPGVLLPQLEAPVQLGTPDSVTSSTSPTLNAPLPNLTIPPPQNSSPFPSSPPSPAPHGLQPGSASAVATNRVPTSANTTDTLSYSTGVAQTSIATSVSTAQSHAQNASAQPGMPGRPSSNTGAPALPIPGVFSGLSSVPPTPNKKRVLPLIGTRNCASSSLEKEKGRKREREAKKPLISLPLTRDSDGALGSTLMRKPSITSPPIPRLTIPNSSSPGIKLDGSPVKTLPESSLEYPFSRPSHSPISNDLRSSPSLSGLSKQSSLPKSQSQPSIPALSMTFRPNGAFNPVAGSTPTIPSGCISPMPRGHGINGVGSPRPEICLPNVFTHHNVSLLGPPPPSPLPSVPTNVSSVSLLVPRASESHHFTANVDRHLALDVGIAGTIGSPLQPYAYGLESSPHYNSVANDDAEVQPSASTTSSVVVRRSSQQGASLKLFSNSVASPTTNSSPISAVPPSTIPVFNTLGPTRSQDTRGCESLSSALTVNNISNVSLRPQAIFSRSGWENSSNLERQNSPVGPDERMEGDMIQRFRQSRIHSLPKDLEETTGTDELIPAKKSYAAIQHCASSVLSDLSFVGNAHSSAIFDDGFAVEECHGNRSTSYNSASTRAPGAYDDYDPEDASYYPEDEMSIRHSHCRSTVYISDEEESWSNSGHGHGSSRIRGRKYSDSIYSRASFLDTEKSGEMRQRFLKHVEAMLNERGERIPPAIPPVPRLPEEFVAEHKRAAAMRKEDMDIVKRTVGVGARRVPAGSGR